MTEGNPTPTTVLTRVVARLLFVPSLVVGVGVLVKGYTDTGDGFTAGLIISLAVLLQYVAFGYREVERVLPVRWASTAAIGGLIIALGVAVIPVLRGEPVLTHAPGADGQVVHLGTLELLTAVLFDVGVCLLVLGFAIGAMGMVARVGERRLP